MAFITEIFGTGVVAPENNEALNRLASLLGTKLVFGSNYAINAAGTVSAIDQGNQNNTLLLHLSAALGPVYLAMLFLILAWIAVGGTIKSAMDGEFLGRDWSSVGVPAGLITSVILLSPVPAGLTGGGGLTLAQVIYVRAITLGSNFGDLVLKTAYESANQQAVNQQLNQQALQNPMGSLQLQAAIYDQVNKRMLAYLPNYLCAEQLIASGVNRQRTFFMSLTNVCKVPAGSVHNYVPYFKHTFETPRMPGNASCVGDANNTFTCETPLPTNMPKDPNITSKEYSCYYDSLRAVMTTDAGISNQLKATLNLNTGVAAITTPSIYPSSKSVGYVYDAGTPMKQIKVNPDLLLAGWMGALNNSVSCLRGKMGVKASSQSFFNTLDPRLVDAPWSNGWAMAASFMSNELNDANRSERMEDASKPFPFTTEIVNPDLSTVPMTGSGPKLKSAVQSLVIESSEHAQRAETLLRNVQTQIKEQAIRANDGSTTVNTNPIPGNVSAPGHGNYADERSIASAVMLGGLITSASGTSPAAAATRKNLVGAIQASGKGADFLGRTASTMGATVVNKGLIRFGSSLQALGSFASGARLWISSIKRTNDNVNETARNISSSGPWGLIAGAGKAIFNGVKGAALAVFSQPGMTEMIFLALTILNIMTLAPQIAMTIALLLWLLRVAAWFLIVPISAVLMALPKTRVGHDAWKEGLSLAMTPGITMLFFVVSMLMYDVVIDVSAAAMFQPYLAAEGPASSIARLLADLLTGELVYRLVAFAGLLTLGFFFCILLILRGPTWALRKLGLGSVDLAEGSTQQMEGMVEKPLRKKPQY